nr:PREDICTED: olfactory receptor 6N2-like [Lepisosteus oculatus]
MAYDRYVAVVKPLHYNNLISTKACITMMFTAWMLGFLGPLLPILLASTLPFCGSNFILHIVCDYHSVMSLACGDFTAQVNFTLSIAMLSINVPFLYILWTYCRIIASVMKLKIMESRKKAFSMCSSHVTVVFLCYGSGAVVYIGLRVERIPPDGRIIIGGFNYLLTPLLNPIIYSLRNEKLQVAFQRLVVKLRGPGLSNSICNWVLDFLTGRPQVVTIGNKTSSPLILNTGATQGSCLSPRLYSLFTHDCVARCNSNPITLHQQNKRVVSTFRFFRSPDL